MIGNDGDERQYISVDDGDYMGDMSVGNGRHGSRSNFWGVEFEEHSSSTSK